MKKIISRKTRFHINLAWKKGFSIFGYLLLGVLILFGALVWSGESIGKNEYIFAQKQVENEDYTWKLGVKQGAEALTKKIEEDIKTSISKEQSSIQKIYIKEATIPVEKSIQNKEKVTDKSNTPKQTTNNSAQINGNKQKEPIYIEEQQGAPIMAEWSKVTASSELNSGGASYKASFVNDRNLNTAWAEGKDGDGIGEWIKLESYCPRVINAVGFENGYQKSEYAYYANNRPKKVRVELSDGTSVTQDLVDRRGGNEIYLGREISTTYVKITILEVYKGSKYQDTCISAIDAYH